MTETREPYLTDEQIAALKAKPITTCVKLLAAKDARIAELEAERDGLRVEVIDLTRASGELEWQLRARDEQRCGTCDNVYLTDWNEWKCTLWGHTAEERSCVRYWRAREVTP